MGIEVLERDPQVPHRREERGDTRAVGLGVEFVGELPAVLAQLQLPFGQFGGDCLQGLGQLQMQHLAAELLHQLGLLLDEPTAGVDVELRRDMWNMVRRLREMGTTIILTTHYIEEAEEMADRVGVINKGELILVEDKTELMKKLGRKVLHLQLAEPLQAIPAELAEWRLELSEDGSQLTFEFDAKADRTGVPSLLAAMRDAGIAFKDLDTHQSSLEDIFVGLIHEKKAAA